MKFDIFTRKMEELIKIINSDNDYNLLDRIKIICTFSSLFVYFKGKIDPYLYKLKNFNYNSSFVKGERFLRNVIRNLEEYSELFFISSIKFWNGC